MSKAQQQTDQQLSELTSAHIKVGNKTQQQFAVTHKSFYWEESGKLIHKDVTLNQLYNLNLMPQSRERMQRFYNDQRISTVTNTGMIYPCLYYICKYTDNDKNESYCIGKVLQIRSFGENIKSSKKKRFFSCILMI